MRDFAVFVSCGCRVKVQNDTIEMKSIHRCEKHSDVVRYLFSIQILEPLGKCLVISDTQSEDELVVSVSNAIPIASAEYVSVSAIKSE